jgi:hypothetical protein
MADPRHQEPPASCGRLSDRERLRDLADRTTQHATVVQESRRLRDENQLMRQRIEAWTVTWHETKQTVDALLDYVRVNNDARDELQRCQHELAATKAMLLRERALRMLLELQGVAGCLPPPATVALPAPAAGLGAEAEPEPAAASAPVADGQHDPQQAAEVQPTAWHAARRGSSASTWLRTMQVAPTTLLLKTE